MITGFNTDIEHEGVTYHVQTEDKGLETPLLLSLVYAGGAILASKRVPYDDLVASGFDEKTLSERLQRQHKLICAAIRAGRIEELKLMSRREAGVRATQKAERKVATPPVVAGEPPVITSEPPSVTGEHTLPAGNSLKPPATTTTAPAIPYKPRQPPIAPPTLRTSPPPIMMRPVPAGEFEFAGSAGAEEEELHLELVEDRDFYAGDVVALRIRVSRTAAGDENSGVANAAVTVKILGTTFRPLICTATTDRDGLTVVFTTLPRFTGGRAAILIRTVVGSRDAELRRIILPSK